MQGWAYEIYFFHELTVNLPKIKCEGTLFFLLVHTKCAKNRQNLCVLCVFFAPLRERGVREGGLGIFNTKNNQQK